MLGAMSAAVSPYAGKPATPAMLVNLGALERAYYELKPDPTVPTQRVAFGTSGHRGSPFDAAFTDTHIAAITQAVCDYRAAQGDRGPLFIGKDTHAVSRPAERTALEVLAANGVPTFFAAADGFTPTPVVSHAILTANRGRSSALADGLIITPSHNPPEDGGFKYNPPNGGPADTDATGWIQDRANAILADGSTAVRRTATPFGPGSTLRAHDFLNPFVEDLPRVIDIDAIRASGVRIGVDPLGGASHAYWPAIAARHRLNLIVVNDRIDPAFGFMTVDHDGKIRMDCSSPYAMAGLVGLKNQFDIAFGNDPDADRHGIVAPSTGLLNPNNYLAVAINYLVRHRTGWPAAAVVGKTVVSSSLIDRVVASLGRTLHETPVGFKYFAAGLHAGTCCFGGEESAGASFLDRQGAAWSTDKDGLILGLLAAEVTAVTGKDPGIHFLELGAALGTPYSTRVDAPATPEQKARLKKLKPAAVKGDTLAGERIQSILTAAPGNNESIGGLKVVAANAWFAARPSGTENIYKVYAESFLGAEHLARVVAEAKSLVTAALD
jgi:phosphoglucomutase